MSSFSETTGGTRKMNEATDNPLSAHISEQEKFVLVKLQRWKKQNPNYNSNLPEEFGLTSNCEICGTETEYVHITNEHEHAYCDTHQEETRKQELQENQYSEYSEYTEEEDEDE